jgi:hypothetical protein
VASRELYAEVLVEIAAALRGGGRVASDGMAMAKAAEVRMRVERILDESRQIAPAMTRGRWALLLCCAAPVIYLAAVMRPARVQAQDPPVAAQPREDAAKAEVAQLEAEIAKFKSENQGRMAEQFQANVAQSNSLQMMLAQKREVLGQLQQERLMLETQLQNLTADSAALALADEPVRALRAQLDAAREVLAAQHPTIRRLEQQLAAESARGAGDRTKSLELDAEMQHLNLQIEEKVKQTEEINRQIGAYQQRIENSAGNLRLSVTFGADGKPEKIEVIRGQGTEQDARAVEWAKALRSGQTGPRVVTVEVPVR